jgi:hypothetical protein
MFNHTIIRTPISINLVSIIARFFTHDNTVSTHSVTFPARQTSESRLDLTRLSTTITVSDVVVITLLARHLDAITAKTDADTCLHHRPRSIRTADPAIFHFTLTVATIVVVHVFVVTALPEHPPTITANGLASSSIKSVLCVICAIESSFQLAH